MSATSFGGSFDLVRSDDSTLRNALKEKTIRSATISALPYISYILPPTKGAEKVDRIINAVLDKRLGQPEDKKKKDLLQILLNVHDQNPTEFSQTHLKDEMQNMMYV